MRSSIVMSLASILLSLVVSAQPAPRIGETIDVTIVNVDVHVTDKRGNRVTGLRAEDFEILENGKLQPITNFSEFTSTASQETMSIESAPAPSGQTPAAATPRRARRSIVIFVEPALVPNFRAKEIFDSIRALLQRTVAPGDQVSIISFQHSMKVRQPFTDDMATVDRVLDTIEKQMSGTGGVSLDENASLIGEMALEEQEFNDMLAGLGITSSVSADVSMSALYAARKQRFFIQQKALALQALMQGISGADGKKIMIMATRRFGRYAGAEFFGGRVPKAYEQELDTAEIRRALVRTANANGITIYPILTEGLRWTTGPDASGVGFKIIEGGFNDSRAALDDNVEMNEKLALQEVAADTGGLAASGSKDIAKMMPRLGDDLEAYYSLGYRATASGKDAARSIVVRTKNRDYTVRSRRQFVEKSETTQMKDRVVANLFQPVEGSSASIPFDVELGKVRQTGRSRWVVPLAIRVPINSLTMLPAGQNVAGQFSVFFATGSALGVMSEAQQKTQKFDIAQGDVERAQKSYFTYELELAVDRIADHVSLAVFDDVGKEFGLKRYELPKR